LAKQWWPTKPLTKPWLNVAAFVGAVLLLSAILGFLWRFSHETGGSWLEAISIASASTLTIALVGIELHKPVKPRRRTIGRPLSTDEERLLADLTVQAIHHHDTVSNTWLAIQVAAYTSMLGLIGWVLQKESSDANSTSFLGDQLSLLLLASALTGLALITWAAWANVGTAQASAQRSYRLSQKRSPGRITATFFSKVYPDTPKGNPSILQIFRILLGIIWTFLALAAWIALAGGS
jgi:hypothetical protein